MVERLVRAVAHMVAGVVDQGGGLEDGEVGCGLAADRLAGELGADAVVGGGEPFDAVGLGPFPAEQPRLGRFFKQPLYMRLFVPSIFQKIKCRFSAESRRPPIRRVFDEERRYFTMEAGRNANATRAKSIKLIKCPKCPKCPKSI